jgi:hypothetical protein
VSEASESAFGEEATLFKDPTEPKKNYRSLPEWLEAWRVLDRFPHLEGALGSFYESIQLNFHHPSFLRSPLVTGQVLWSIACAQIRQRWIQMRMPLLGERAW